METQELDKRNITEIEIIKNLDYSITGSGHLNPKMIGLYNVETRGNSWLNIEGYDKQDWCYTEPWWNLSKFL